MLTRAIEGTEASSAALIWDDKVKGFGHAAPLGGAKFCVLSYRAGRGRNAPPAAPPYHRQARLALDARAGAAGSAAAARRHRRGR